MHTFSIHRLLGVALISLLAACTPIPDPTPTPAEPISNATIVVERETAVPPTARITPTFTQIPIDSPTVPATNTPTPTAVADEENNNPPPFSPTLTPLPILQPGLFNIASLSNDTVLTEVSISSQGQLAFIQNKILYVEIEPLSGRFLEIGRYAQAAAWSPDGTQLAYSLSDNPIATDPAARYEQYLWSAVNRSSRSFSELLPSYSSPRYYPYKLFWSPDGTKFLIYAYLRRQDAAVWDFQDKFMVTTIDFAQNTFSGNKSVGNEQVVWLTNTMYFVDDSIGASLPELAAYNYAGLQVSSPAWFTISMETFAPSGDFLITTKRFDMMTPIHNQTELPPFQVEELNLSTGEFRLLWEAPLTSYTSFPSFFRPRLSPDEQFITFNYGSERSVPGTMYIIDRTNGLQYGQFDNSYPLAWRSNNDLVYTQISESGTSHLLNYSLGGAVKTIFTTEPPIKILAEVWAPNASRWSPDELYFFFTTANEEIDTEQLYLWRSDNDAVQLIHSTLPGKRFYNQTWLPDSQGFYFTVGVYNWQTQELWRYDLEPAAP